MILWHQILLSSHSFYTSTQAEDEDVAVWAIRLEDIIQRVESEGLISRGTKFEMLRTKLWSGLADEQLKQATRYKYDTTKDYDQLVVEIRKVEQEMNPTSDTTKKMKEKKTKTQMIHQKKEVGEDGPNWKKLEEKLEHIEKELSDLKADRQESTGGFNVGNSRGSYRGTHGRGRGSGGFRGRGGRRGRRNQTYYQQEDQCGGQKHYQQEDQYGGQKGSQDDKGDIVCYKCGQVGHIALGCRVRTDHLKQKNLNGGSPVLGGKH